MLLPTTLDVPSFTWDVLGLLGWAGAARGVLIGSLVGAGLWWSLAALHRGRSGGSWAQAFEAEAFGFRPLYLRPLLTIAALAAVSWRGTYPYGFTLPVALTQDWAPAQDVLALAALVAWRRPALRVPVPGALSLGFLAFLTYALASPPWAREWDQHPGNEPKTLRMAVALGHGWSLDVEGVSAAMEDLPALPFHEAAARAAASLGRHSVEMLRALVRGPEAVGAGAIRATRVTRQTVRGKEGGVFHVLAPGPSLLLAPGLRVDRALNLARGTRGRLAVTLLAWNALAAWLVAALFLLIRDATGRPGLSAGLAGGAALAPPFVFYAYQFYPEMLGALGLTLAFRALLFVPAWSTGAAWRLGLVLALLPWLHQKFLPVWGVLTLWALLRAVDQMATLRAILGLLLPQAASLYLTALYNFAITGSVRPDALFLAWGPAGVTSARVGQGVLGLLLDARYGILPYAPIYLLAAGGLVLGRGAGPGAQAWQRGARGLRYALPAVLVYYLTVASADNWSGAVCNLGRYAMPVVPYAVALVGLALAATAASRGVLALALALAGWTAVLSSALFEDPHAANDCALLLAKGVFADGNVYLPNLFIRTWSGGAPGLAARIGVALGIACALGLWIRRAAAGRGGGSPDRLWLGVLGVALAAGLALERWPGGRLRPSLPSTLEIGSGGQALLSGPVRMHDGLALAGSGEVRFLVRAYRPLETVRVLAGGNGMAGVPGRPRVPLSVQGVSFDVPLTPLRTLTGKGGVQETFLEGRLFVDSPAEIVLRPLSGS